MLCSASCKRPRRAERATSYRRPITGTIKGKPRYPCAHFEKEVKLCELFIPVLNGIVSEVESRVVKQDGRFVELKTVQTYGKCRKHTQTENIQERKLTDGKLYVAHNRQKWRGFKLIRGHVYGMVQGELYVSAAEPDSNRPGHIMVYKQVCGPNYAKWVKLSINASSTLGALVIETVKSSPYKGVEFPDSETDCSRSKPHFPTFQSRRPEATPPLPRSVKAQTWVDRICQKAAG